MIYRTTVISLLLACFSFVLPHAAGAQSAAIVHGKVTEVVEAAGYTYVEVASDNNVRVWAAGPITALKVGDSVDISTHMPMANFHSKAMNRDFDMIYFVDSFAGGNNATMTHAEVPASPHSNVAAAPMASPVEGIARVSGGNTIAEIHADKNKLNGKSLRVRGKVVKFTGGIMGKNWLHIMDSSSADDLTVTTDSMVAVDDVVIIEGKLAVDKDFNYGYKYPVIVEDARVTKE